MRIFGLPPNIREQHFLFYIFFIPPLLCCVPTLVLLSLFLMLVCVCEIWLFCTCVCVCVFEFNPQKLNISNPPTKKPPGQISTHSPPGNDTSPMRMFFFFTLDDDASSSCVRRWSSRRSRTKGEHEHEN